MASKPVRKTGNERGLRPDDCQVNPFLAGVLGQSRDVGWTQGNAPGLTQYSGVAGCAVDIVAEAAELPDERVLAAAPADDQHPHCFSSLSSPASFMAAAQLPK
jgi:hypothetical protein